MKTLIDVDDELLAAAAVELGTATKKDTVNTALRIIAQRRERTRLLLGPAGEEGSSAEGLLRLGVGEDITDAEVMRQARR